MARMRKGLFRLLPWSMVAVLVLSIAFGGITQYGVKEVKAANGVSENIQLLDTNGNGEIDRITFDIDNDDTHTWELNGSSPYGLSVTQATNGITISSVSLTTAADADPVGVQVDLNEADIDLLVNTDGVTTGVMELIYTQVTGDQTCTNCIRDGTDNELNAIATGDTGTTDTEADAASPIVVSATILDVGDDGSTNNGKVDHLELLFSEAIDDSTINNYSAGTDYAPTSLAVAVVSNEMVDASEGICPNDAAEDDSYLCIIFDEDAGTCDGTSQAGCDTDEVDQDITWTGASITLQDQATSANTVDDLGSGDVTEADGAGPVAVGVQTQDVGSDGSTYNGKVDHLEVVFSENIDDSTINNYNASTDYAPTSLAIANVTNEMVDAGEGVCENDSAEDDQYLCLIFDEDANTCGLNDQTGCDTDAVDQDLTWTGASATIQDSATNNSPDLGSGDVTEADGAAPIAVGAQTEDTDDNGKVDHLEVVFSENIDDSATNNYNASTNYTPSTLALANVTGEAVQATEGTCTNDAAEDDEYLCISFTEDAGTCDATSQAGCDTDAVDQDLTWTGASTTIQDSATNITQDIGSGNITEADGAGPVALGADVLDIGDDGSTFNGKMDHIEVVFSENIDDSTLNNYNASADYTPTSLAIANVSGDAVDADEVCPNDGAEDDEYLCFVFTEDAGTCDVTSQAGCDTDAVDQDITWTGASATIQDSSNNNSPDLGSGDITEADAAGPVAVGAQTLDIGDDGSTFNGKVDHLEVVFSENIDDSTINNYNASTDYAPSTLALANVSNEMVDAGEGICPNDAAEDDEYLCVIFDEDAGTCDVTSQAGCDTDAVDQDLTWTGTSVTIQDSGTNNSPDLASGGITEVDGAAPVAVGARTQDVGADGSTFNGKVDHLEVVFSEAIDDDQIDNYNGGANYQPNSLAIANVTNAAVEATEGVCGNDAAEDDEYLCLIFDEDAGTCDATDQTGCDTDAIDQDLTWTGASTDIQDSSSNVTSDIGSGDITESDDAPGVVVGRVTLDTDQADGSAGTANGTMDGILAYFSEAMDASSVTTSEFSLFENDDTALTESYGDTTDDDTLFFGCSNCPSDDTGDLLKLQITGGTILDLVGDAVVNEGASVAATDGAAPFPLSAVYLDSNTDAEVDRIDVTFSADNTLACTFEAGDWSVVTAGSVNVNTPSACTASGNDVRLTVDADPNETSGGTDPEVRYQNLGTLGSIVDAAGNQTGDFGASGIQAGDAAAPVILSTNPVDNATGVGVALEPTVTFSEAINTGSFTFTAGVAPTGGYTVTWSGGDTVATFTHGNNFDNNTTYDIEVTAAPAQANGTALGGALVPNPFDFSTSSGGGGGGGGAAAFCGAISSNFVINGGATHTNKTKVTLDITPGGATQMIFSLDPNFTNASWMGVENTFEFDLGDTLGNRMVYGLFRSNCRTGNDIIRDIIYDPLANDTTTDPLLRTEDPFDRVEIPRPGKIEVPIEIVDLRLESVQPINVVTSNGQDQWAIHVTLEEDGVPVASRPLQVFTSRPIEDTIENDVVITGVDGKALIRVSSRFAGVSTLTFKVDDIILRETAGLWFSATPEEIPQPLIKLEVGDLIKTASSPAVYFYASDGKRHPFMNGDVFFSYFDDFSDVITIPDRQMAGIPLGANAKLRPGTWLVKIQSDPKVYAVTPGGVLRWVSTEQIARTLYGENWNQRVLDIPVSFFNVYTIGDDITQAVLPDGSFFQFIGGTDYWYVQDGKRRKFTGMGRTDNGLSLRFLLQVPDTVSLEHNQADIQGPEVRIVDVDC